MREIKFRVWDKYNKIFYYLGNCYVSVESINRLMAEKKFTPWCQIKLRHTPVVKTKNIKFNQDNYVIQQYTGLKDKNGKDIFEGDIIKDLKSFRVNYVVNWTDWVGMIMFESKGQVCDLTQFSPEDDGEIVGNIFETPKLIK